MNLVYFVCHDLGRMLGSYGARVLSPHLDEFAKESIRFTNAHCASPACSPSRACAMSGIYPHRSGALGLSHMGWPLPNHWLTTVDDFNAAGYQTILSGINHERHPRSDRYEVDLSHCWDDWKLPHAVDNALKALKSRDKKRPFYLNIATQEPHACIWKDVGHRIPSLPDSFQPFVPEGMPRTAALEKAFHRFASCILFLDTQFGRLLDGLKKLQLLDETLIVFTTDHGISGPRGKGSLYGLGTEIALLVRHPNGNGAGETRSSVLSNLDFRPTFAEACGVDLTSPCDGHSRWKEWIKPPATGNPHIFLSRNYHGEKPWRTEDDYIDCYDPIRAIRTQSHLYIRNFKPEAKPPEPGLDIKDLGSEGWNNWESSWGLPAEPRPDEELYVLEDDPAELKNQVSNPGQAKNLGRLRQLLEKTMQDTDDFVPGDCPFLAQSPGWGPHWQ